MLISALTADGHWLVTFTWSTGEWTERDTDATDVSRATFHNTSDAAGIRLSGSTCNNETTWTFSTSSIDEIVRVVHVIAIQRSP